MIGEDRACEAICAETGFPVARYAANLPSGDLLPDGFDGIVLNGVGFLDRCGWGSRIGLERAGREPGSHKSICSVVEIFLSKKGRFLVHFPGLKIVLV